LQIVAGDAISHALSDIGAIARHYRLLNCVDAKINCANPTHRGARKRGFADAGQAAENEQSELLPRNWFAV